MTDGEKAELLLVSDAASRTITWFEAGSVTKKWFVYASGQCDTKLEFLNVGGLVI